MNGLPTSRGWLLYLLSLLNACMSCASYSGVHGMPGTELSAFSYRATDFAVSVSLFALRQGLNQLLRLALNYSIVQESLLPCDLFLLQLSSSCAKYHMLDAGKHHINIFLIYLTATLQGRPISQTRRPRLGEVKDMSRVK